MVILQPSEDRPSMWPAVPPAQCGRRVLGPHACHCYQATVVRLPGAKNCTRKVRDQLRPTKGKHCPVQPGSTWAQGACSGADNRGQGVPQEALFSPMRLDYLWQLNCTKKLILTVLTRFVLLHKSIHTSSTFSCCHIETTTLTTCWAFSVISQFKETN